MKCHTIVNVTPPKKSIPIIVLLLVGISVLARVVVPWTEAELQKASQLIVVGTVTKVQDLDEVNTTLWPGRSKLLGLEATLVVSKVLKGDFTNRTVILHYYRWETPFPTSSLESTIGTDVNSPGLIYLTLTNTNQFLLYLVSDGTSRYAPASGQLDSAQDAVRIFTNIDNDLTKQISNILTECQNIKSGMTRAELSKVFTTEGGLSTASHRTYVYRGCPYIKVDVDFTLLDPKQDDEKPTDTISKISKPYLEWSILD